MREFRYLRDPMFLSALAIYLANRFVLADLLGVPFLHAHLNDLLLVPLCVPAMLFVQRRLRCRGTDAPPHATEIIVPVVVISVVFEILMPRMSFPGPAAISDHRDIVWYCAGGLVAGGFWSWWYRPGGGSSASTPVKHPPCAAAAPISGPFRCQERTGDDRSGHKDVHL